MAYNTLHCRDFALFQRKTQEDSATEWNAQNYFNAPDGFDRNYAQYYNSSAWGLDARASGKHEFEYRCLSESSWVLYSVDNKPLVGFGVFNNHVVVSSLSTFFVKVDVVRAKYAEDANEQVFWTHIVQQATPSTRLTLNPINELQPLHSTRVCTEYFQGEPVVVVATVHDDSDPYIVSAVQNGCWRPVKSFKSIHEPQEALPHCYADDCMFREPIRRSSMIYTKRLVSPRLLVML